MILLDKPYISDFLIKTIEDNNFQVIQTEIVNELYPDSKMNLISEEDAIQKVKDTDFPLLYTNSENSIHWIENNLDFSNFPEKIKFFKDKVHFRKLISRLYPSFYFKEIQLKEIDSFDISNVSFPLVLKPSIGFFSLGVYMIDDKDDWESAVSNIHNDIENYKHLYPIEVLNVNSFILEECIIGDEYAVDSYIDKDGNPVVLNILEHKFSSGKDVSDRVYMTSKKILKKTISLVEEFLKEISLLTDLRNFPLHIEIRIDKSGKMTPIEINPLRFGGWCTTADFTWYSNGYNSYEYFFKQLKPNWDEVFKKLGDSVFSMSVLNNSTGVEGKDIKSFDYDKLYNKFESPILVRKTDFKSFPLFGFLFLETKPENIEEIDWILKTDLKEFISCK